MHAGRLMLLAAALPTIAAAQRLNLGPGPDEPRPGEGRAALALADLLEQEAAGAAPAEGAVRRLAAGLLRSGESAGPEGAEAVLAGLTLAARRPEIDSLLASADPAIAHLTEGAAASIAPRDVDLALRDALAPLIDGPALACGWWSPSDSDAETALRRHIDSLLALADNRRLSDEASAALAEMVELLELSLAHPGYLRSGLDWAALLASAAGALDEPPSWLDMPARDRIRDDLSTGLTLCLDKPDEARTVLSRLAAYLRIIRAVDAMSGPAQSRELREALNRLLSVGDTDPLRDPGAISRIERTFSRALHLAGADERLPEQTTLVRQVRPMIGPLVETHRRAEDSAMRVLPALLGASDPMTEPAVLAAMNALTRSARDLEMPARLSAMLAGWPEGVADPRPGREPSPVRTVAPLAEHIRELGVLLTKDADAPAAMGALRTIESLAEPLLALPGETDLRAIQPSPAWSRIVADQSARIAFVIDQARETWVRAHSSDQFAAERDGATDNFRALAESLAVLQDGATLEAILADWARRNDPAANAWPGWEIAPAGADLLAEGLRERLSRLAAAVARGDSLPEAGAMASEIRRDAAAALLMGRLERACRERQTPCAAAAELGSGPPLDDAWLLEHRHALAQVCRSVYEAAAADGEMRAKFLAHANRTALPVLDALP